jgi:hypothetical protein
VGGVAAEETAGGTHCPPIVGRRRKQEGAVYTPAFITRYLVEQALGGVLKARFETLRRQHETEAADTARKTLADPNAYDLATAELRVVSPHAQSLHNAPGRETASDMFFRQGEKRGGKLRREQLWLDLETLDKQPLKKQLGGLGLEYRIVSLYSRDAGRREAKLVFDIGQGTQDLVTTTSTRPAARITHSPAKGYSPPTCTGIARGKTSKSAVTSPGGRASISRRSSSQARTTRSRNTRISLRRRTPNCSDGLIRNSRIGTSSASESARRVKCPWSWWSTGILWRGR